MRLTGHMVDCHTKSKKIALRCNMALAARRNRKLTNFLQGRCKWISLEEYFP
jgi:hypothetical protein